MGIFTLKCFTKKEVDVYMAVIWSAINIIDIWIKTTMSWLKYISIRCTTCCNFEFKMNMFATLLANIS